MRHKRVVPPECGGHVILLSVPVLLYQLFFVVLMYAGNRIGPRAGIVVLVLALSWTATHVFLPPLMILQASVIVVSWVFSRRRLRATRQPASLPPPPGVDR